MDHDRKLPIDVQNGHLVTSPGNKVAEPEKITRERELVAAPRWMTKVHRPSCRCDVGRWPEADIGDV